MFRFHQVNVMGAGMRPHQRFGPTRLASVVTRVGGHRVTVRFQQRLAAHSGHLSAGLRAAGDYVATNPVDTASRSLRSVADESGLSPAMFSRLARALDYGSFEDLREDLRAALGPQVPSFAARTRALQADPDAGGGEFARAHLAAAQTNLEATLAAAAPELLERIVARLHGARKVRVLGQLGATGMAEYMTYLAQFCTDGWALAARMGASLGAGLEGLGEGDALIVISKPPHAGRVIRAAEMARGQGAYVVVLTDSHASEILSHASDAIVLPGESPHFYTSYVSTLAVIEAIIGMLAHLGGAQAQARMARIEGWNGLLDDVRQG